MFLSPASIITMVSIHGYNKEKKRKGFSDIYFMALCFGLFCAFVFVGGLKFFIFIVSFVIKNWVWVFVIVAVLFVVFKFVLPRRRKHE